MSRKQLLKRLLENVPDPPAGFEMDESGVYMIESDGSRVQILKVPLWVSGMGETPEGEQYAIIEWITENGEHRKAPMLLSVLDG